MEELNRNDALRITNWFGEGETEVEFLYVNQSRTLLKLFCFRI